MMGIGIMILEIVAPILEIIAPIIPGKIFPYFFKMEMFQRALVAALLVTVVAGLLGVFLLIQNLALIGDGLAHVSFGGVAVGVVLGATSPLWYALVFSIIAAILIHELQYRELLTGDASIAIFLTSMLALGMVILRLGGGGFTVEIESYLFGNLLLIDETDLDMIALICVLALSFLAAIRSTLLACTIDPLAARIQGLPVRGVGLLFSIITAAVVVSMVQVVGTLLVTALLVTPAATAQLIGRSFRSCLIWTQVFGFSSVLGGLYLSSELGTGSGSMIALFSAIIFAIVILSRSTYNRIFQSNEN
tara:strand:- start:2141 stop:3055 length:915 start_codon:yes stop_codon:yes gene_type:complete